MAPFPLTSHRIWRIEENGLPNKRPPSSIAHCARASAVVMNGPCHVCAGGSGFAVPSSSLVLLVARTPRRGSNLPLGDMMY